VTVRVAAHHLAQCDYYYETDLSVDSDWWEEEDIRSLSKAIFSLPDLESLQVQFDMEDSLEVLPFYQIFHAMGEVRGGGARRQLRRLCIEDMHLVESSSQTDCLMAFADKLQRLPCLQELRLGIKSKRSEPIQLEPFLKVLSSMRTLRTVEISDRGLENFMMGGMTCQGASMGNYIASSPQLVELKICEDNFNFCDEDVLLIASALDRHKKLESLEIYSQEGRKSSSSKFLSSRVPEAFLKVLKRNCTLVKLSVYASNTAKYQENYGEKISFYLRSNKAGRGLLTQENYPTREQWLGKLLSLRNDVDSSFQMLSSNPSILLR